jgi:hypothetical protein
MSCENLNIARGLTGEELPQLGDNGLQGNHEADSFGSKIFFKDQCSQLSDRRGTLLVC